MSEIFIPTLPELAWRPTAASGPRHGHPVNLVVVHRWGVRYVDKTQEEKSYEGVVHYFLDPAHDASAHIVYAGVSAGAHPPATQMVAWADYAWAEAAYNPGADDIESADAIWLGKDPRGMEVLARIVADRLRARNLPPVWSSHQGFCRHADLGAAGGGHTYCPTTDIQVWRAFVTLVQYQYHRGGFRRIWGR